METYSWGEMKYTAKQASEADCGEGESKKVLVTGWFSFEVGHATAGDLLAGDLACEWLECRGYTYDIALAPPFRGGVDWRSVDPRAYSHIVFVCGPFQNGVLEAEILNYFADCKFIGLNLSMLEPLDRWNPFDVLLERDSAIVTRPDIVFASRQEQCPVVGVVLVEPYTGAMTQAANDAIGRLLDTRELSVVRIDTRLDANSTGLRSAREIETLIARMDVVVTTRLHGMVLALKNGVPVIAVDPEAGGAKIQRQARKLEWPAVFAGDSCRDEALLEALDYCLSEEARAKAIECYKRAAEVIHDVRDQFISEFVGPEKGSPKTLPQRPQRWLRDQWQGSEAHSFAQELEASQRKHQRRALHLQKLREENRRLARRGRKLKRELKSMRNSNCWKLLMGVRHLRDVVLRK